MTIGPGYCDKLPVKCECGFVMGFSETGRNSDGMVCHYCTIERNYFLEIFCAYERAEDEKDIEESFETFFEKLRESQNVRTGPNYGHTKRNKEMENFLNLVTDIHWKPDLLKVDK